MAIRAILFDNDGTLVDTHDLIASSMRYSTFRVLGRVIPDAVLMEQVGIPLADQMLQIADGDLSVRDELLRVYRAHNHAHHDAEVKAFPGVAEGLAALRDAGFRLGVVTSKMHALAQRGLELVGVWPYFDCLIGADDCPRAKPDPDPILLAARLMGFDAGECAYVGDSPFDMRAGNAAGCVTAAVLWGMFPQSVLMAEAPHFACESFDQLVNAMRRL